MKEAQKPDTASYRTFNEFFVRPLRDEVRPIDTDRSFSTTVDFGGYEIT